MKIVRNVLICVLFVAAVFISSANVQLVEIVYLPATGLASGWEPLSVRLPLFVIVLGALGIGALLGGAAGLFEQARLHLALRQSRKAEHKATESLAATQESIASEREAAEGLRRELETTRAAAQQARRSLTGGGTPPDGKLPPGGSD